MLFRRNATNQASTDPGSAFRDNGGCGGVYAAGCGGFSAARRLVRHLHSRYSNNAYAIGSECTPDDSNRDAKGESISVPGGRRARIDAPLDFLAVTGHAEFLGAGVAGATDFHNALSSVGEDQPSVDPDARGSDALGWSAAPGIQLRRPGRHLGEGEHPRSDLRCITPARDLCHDRPRIQVRIFGGWLFEPGLLDRQD